MALGRRLLLVCVLLLVLSGTFVAYGALGPAPTRDVFPDSRDLARDYDRHLGERASVGGTVVATDPVVIAAGDGRGGTIELTVVETRRRPALGDDFRVYGTVRPDRTLVARRSVVVPPSGGTYAYVVSALAGLWVLGRVVQYWRLDPDAGLVRRATPLPGPYGLARLAGRGGDDA
jgi:hypothetical protein